MTETTFEDLLARDGVLVYKTRGVSMRPMLRQNRDLVTIEKPAGRLKKYDTALYRRGTQYVLHRVIAVREGGYLIRGDNCVETEQVADGQILGVLRAFTRDGKTIPATDRGYCLYVRLWCALYPVRRVFMLARRTAGRCKRALAGWWKR